MATIPTGMGLPTLTDPAYGQKEATQSYQNSIESGGDELQGEVQEVRQQFTGLWPGVCPI
jgi:hypothetical protein